MPIAPRSPKPTTTPAEPDGLRAYVHHGVHLEVRGSQGTGDCPFCGKENGKFSVNVDDSKFKCWVCNANGNALTFIRLLWERSNAATTPEFRNEVTTNRKLLDPTTVSLWGVVRSIVSRSWLVPGYGADGSINQLYRRQLIKGSWRLLPTPGLSWAEGKKHAFHRATYDAAKPCVDWFEGPWDGMSAWECYANSDTNILAVPGCNVWQDEWTEMCRGKQVTLWFDSDHPIPEALKQGNVVRPGLDGMYRIARKLSGIASSVRFIRWGKEGYDESKPTGWDVRDHLSGATDRVAAMAELTARVEDAPPEWFTPVPSVNGEIHEGVPGVEPMECDNWAKCRAAWEEALEWRQDLDDTLLVMLAVAASTNQAGDNQLFLKVIADPGSAKTRLCKGLLVSRNCKAILHLKSFHSGWKKKGEEGRDCSLVSRINGKCLVTPEADALSIGLSGAQLDSQMRQIFDGESGNTYANSDEDRQYKGIRSPWIQAGTPALMDRDQSSLGDRFLRIRIHEPVHDQKRSIMLRSLRNERQAVLETSNGTEGSIIPPKLRKAYALTGGLVDWLRANVEQKIGSVEMDESAELHCCDLAELVADVRARPNADPRKTEVHHTKELGSRLAGQFARLSLCLCVVMGKTEVDGEVLRIVRKVARDTGFGYTSDIMGWLCGANPLFPGQSYQTSGGLMEGLLLGWMQMKQEKLNEYLHFLKKINVLRRKAVSSHNGSWFLTQRAYELYLRVMGD